MKLYSLQELSELTGISYETLKRRCQRGTIKASKIGRMWVVKSPEAKRVYEDVIQEGK